jgi:hypothetical protein
MACDLLLSERDYLVTKADGGEEDSSATTTTTTSPTKNGKSDLEQMQDLLKLCRQSAKIIDKEAASISTATASCAQIPAMPQHHPAARERISTQPTLLVPRTQVKPTALTKKNILPRTMARHPNNALKRSNFERQLPPVETMSKRSRSNSAVSTSEMLSGGGANALPTSFSTTSSPAAAMVAKPPPSALHFLAKLNKDNSNTTTSTATTARNDKNSSNKINTEKKKKDMTTSTTEKAELPPEAPAKRKLPPRSSRK